MKACCSGRGWAVVAFKAREVGQGGAWTDHAGRAVPLRGSVVKKWDVRTGGGGCTDARAGGIFVEAGVILMETVVTREKAEVAI